MKGDIQNKVYRANHCSNLPKFKHQFWSNERIVGQTDDVLHNFNTLVTIMHEQIIHRSNSYSEMRSTKLQGAKGLFGRKTLYRPETKTAYKDRFKQKKTMQKLIHKVLLR